MIATGEPGASRSLVDICEVDESMATTQFQGKRLLKALALALLSVCVVTPLVKLELGLTRTLKPSDRIGDTNAVTSKYRDSDRIMLIGDDRPDSPVAIFHYGKTADGRTWEQLFEVINRQQNQVRLSLEDGKLRYSEPSSMSVGTWRLVDGAENAGHSRFEGVAYNRARETRVIRKAAQYALSLMFLFGLWWFSLKRRHWRHECGLATAGRAPWDWLRGIALGLVSLGVYMTFLTLLGQRQALTFDAFDRSVDFLGYLLASPIVNMLQDLLFFGFLFEVLGRRVAATALFFALGHYLKIPKETLFDSSTVSIGAQALLAMAEGLRELVVAPQRLLGLATVGWILASLRVQRGTLWLSMGLHAGWYVARGVGRKISDDLRGSQEWIWGTDSFHDGLMGTGFLLVTWAIARRLPVNEKIRAPVD